MLEFIITGEFCTVVVFIETLLNSQFWSKSYSLRPRTYLKGIIETQKKCIYICHLGRHLSLVVVKMRASNPDYHFMGCQCDLFGNFSIYQ